MRKHLVLTLTASLAVAAPLAAQQQSVQDYTLPDPDATPTPAPRAQGPVDDSGVVPVAPRVIPTDRPTAQPSPIPTPRASATPSATPAPQPTVTATPQPRFTSGPVPAEPRVARPQEQAPATQVPEPAESPEPSAADDSESTAIPGFSGDSAAIPTDVEAAATDAGDLVPAGEQPWGWIAGALIALLALLAGFIAWRRRAEIVPPVIEKPTVTNAPDTAAVAERPRFVASVQIVSAQRSVMMVMVKYRLSIANRSERAMRGVAVSADLVSARNQGGLDTQLATLATELPASSSIERIGPHQTQTVTGTLQLALQEVEVLRQGSIPMFVPLLRVRVEGENIDPFVETYAVGVGNAAAGTKLRPLPLNGPPGSYEGVRAKPLAAKAA